MRVPISGEERRDEYQRKHAMEVLATGTLATFDFDSHYVVTLRHKTDHAQRGEFVSYDPRLPPPMYEVYYAEISKVQERPFYIYETPDYSKMSLRAVSNSAVEELKRRAMSWWRKSVRRFTGRK